MDNSGPHSRLDANLVAMAVALGLGGGLVEGLSHMGLQAVDVLAHAWYPIIWIAAVTNGIVVGGIGLFMALGLWLLPARPVARRAAVFGVACAAALPVLALVLYEWIAPYAIFILASAAGAVFTRWIARDEARRLGAFRRVLPWMAAVTIVAVAGIEGGAFLQERLRTRALPSSSDAAPNVLLIIVDALRADHLSSYGYPRGVSPALDRLAAEGVLFEKAFSTSSYTLPSHASILNGLYAYQHGVEWRSFHAASRQHRTLPEELQTKGYRTAGFSGNTFWFTRAHGFGRGFLHFEDFFHSPTDKVMRTAYGRMAVRLLRRRLGWNDIIARKRAPETNRAVLRWLDRDPQRPFFVAINYMDVHDPYLPPEPFRGRFSAGAQPGGLINWELHVPGSLTPAELQSEIDAYDGAIAYVDEQIAALLASIKTRLNGRDLLVVVTSDHGEEFGEHGGFLHGGHLYRETIHVPLVLWQPGIIPGGIRVQIPVSNAAIPATVMDLAVAEQRRFQGPSLQQLWSGTASSRSAPRSDLEQRSWEPARLPVQHGSLRSLVSSGWHYIEHDTFGAALYDFVNDPHETVNLADRPEVQDMLQRFRDQIATDAKTRDSKRPD